MIVWGGSGEEPGNLISGGQFDPVTKVWTPLSTTGAPTPRTAYTAVWTGTRMVVWGGRTGSPNRAVPGNQFDPGDTVIGTGAQYDPSNDTWTTISGTGAPTPRFGHTAVWAGSQLIVWGGMEMAYDLGNETFVNTGGRLATLSLYVKQ